MGATRFGLVPYSFQYAYQWCPPNTWCSHSPFLTTPVCMRQIARRVLLSENSSAISTQWRLGGGAGISKRMRIRLGRSTSLVVVDHLSLTSH
jgi:hypothetical protein